MRISDWSSDVCSSDLSRPRALRQMGIDAETLLHEQPQLTWLALNGYGRGEPQEQWIAYGDDAGVAGGLTELQRRASGEAVFIGDAIADPLTGLHAAVAAWLTSITRPREKGPRSLMRTTTQIGRAHV